MSKRRRHKRQRVLHELDNRSQRPHPENQYSVGELSVFKRTLLSAAFLATIASFIIGLYATMSGQSQTITTFSFLTSFASFVVGTIQAFPRLTANVKKSIKTIINMTTYCILVLAIASTPVLAWTASQQPVVKIGVGLPFSDNRQDAEPIFKAVKLAIKKFTNGTNKIGDYEVQLVPFDDKEIGNVAKILSPENLDETVATQKIADFVRDSRLIGIIGPFDSGKALVELPIAHAAKMPILTPANTNDCLTDQAFATGDCDVSKLGTGYYFRAVSTDSVRTSILAKTLRSTYPDAKKVVIFRDGSPFGSQFAERFKESWNDISNTSSIQLYDLSGEQEADAEKDLADLKSVPDIVVFAGTGIKGINLHKVMQNDSAYKNTPFASAASIMNGGFYEHLRQSPSGKVYAVTPMPYNKTAKPLSDFINAYNTEYASTPTPYAASAFDATQILLKAMKDTIVYTAPPLPILEKTDSFREAITSNIKGVNTSSTTALKGVTGTIRFEANGDAVYGGTDKSSGVTLFVFNNDTKSWDALEEEN